MKIRLRTIVAVVFVILLFVSLPLIFSVWKKSTGMQMNKDNAALRERVRVLANENLLLEYEAARLAGRGRIEAAATGLGLVYPDGREVVVIAGENTE